MHQDDLHLLKDVENPENWVGGPAPKPVDHMVYGRDPFTSTESDKSEWKKVLAYEELPPPSPMKKVKVKHDPNLAYGKLPPPPPRKTVKVKHVPNIAYGPYYPHPRKQDKPESAGNLTSGVRNKELKLNEDSPGDADDEGSSASEKHSDERGS
jgi:hypothetical protein